MVQVPGDEEAVGNPSHVVAIGASAGGVDALQALARELPEKMTAAVVVVLHVAPHAPSILADILDRAAKVPVRRAEDHRHLVPGEVVVAVPDRHLLVQGHEVRTVFGPQENGHRPAIDALFRSVARWWGSRAVGVVLSGALDDGTAGLAEVAGRGGLALVQDPAEASVSAMPQHALAAVPTAEVLTVREIARRIGDLRRAAVEIAPASELLSTEQALVERGAGARWMTVAGEPAGLSCPDCGGPLFESYDAEDHFRCRVGHAWSAASLVRRNGAEIERALWTAVRIVEDDLALQSRVRERAEVAGRSLVARRMERRLASRREALDSLYDVLRRLSPEEAEHD
jgi:two-component system chemotaxis response regulator CheB